MNSLGITKEFLLSGQINSSSLRLRENEITAEVILDMLNVAKECTKDPFDEISMWLKELTNINVAIPALKTKLYKLLAEKRKKGGSFWIREKNKIFSIPTCTSGSAKSCKMQEVVEESKEELIKELTKQVHVTEDKIKKKEGKLIDVKKEKLSLKRKLKRSEDKNVKYLKKLSDSSAKDIEIKNLEIKLADSQKTESYISEVEKKIEDVNKEIYQSHKDRDDLEDMVDDMTVCLQDVNDVLNENSRNMESITEENCELREENKKLLEENDYLNALLNDDKNELTTFDEERGTFSPQLTNCVMNLLNMQVASRNVSSVIEEVCKLSNCTPNRLPSRQTVDRMGDRRVSLSTKQLTTIAERENLTLYSDETSKYGRCYEVFAVSDENKTSYVLGLREMSCKSSATVLETFQDILDDISNLCTDSEKSTGSEIGMEILRNVKNTMSDRAATEKKFHQLLQEFRMDILPKFVENWNSLTKDEQSMCGRMNNFFCGLHLLVNFADICSDSMKKFECLKLSGQDKITEEGQSECGTIRLIRTCSKAFAKGVNEKSGVHGPYSIFMAQKNETVKFIRYKHNRFNIFFVLGYIVYHHRNLITEFLTDYSWVFKQAFGICVG